MRKRFLNWANVLLGTLTASLVGGCSGQKVMASSEPAMPKKYGPPVGVLEEVRPETQAKEQQLSAEPEELLPTDTLSNAEQQIREPEPEPCIYGPPPGSWDEEDAYTTPADDSVFEPQAPEQKADKKKGKK